MSARDGRDATTDAAAPSLVPPGLVPGAVIAGRYRLEARLGGGGGGTVWRCHDGRLGQAVALKIVEAGGDLERWRREVAMARRIADRNVCRVHDLGETSDLRFVTMELIEGTTLRHRLRGELPAAEARALFAQIASGAAAIHAAGVVHRDLKPENIVVATDGRAVIVDFGLAREPRARGAAPTDPVAPGALRPHPAGEPLDPGATVNLRLGAAELAPRPGHTVTNAGVAVGTPRYMSPEQAAGDAVDARTDVWALGLIGHELLTGALPAPQVADASDADAPGRRIDPAVETRLPGITAVLRRCLAADADRRYADARALVAAIAAIDRPAHRPRRGARIALAAGALAAIAAGALVATRRDEPRASEPRAPAQTTTPTPPPRDHGGPAHLVAHRTGDAELFPVVGEPERWPGGAAVAVAVARDGKRFAYSTAGGDLYVQSIAPGARPAKWTAPRYPRSPVYRESLIALWCVGWFSDGSLAVIGTTYRDGHHLFQTYPDGRSRVLHTQSTRFAAAVARDDRVVIAISGDGVFALAAAPPLAADAQAPGQVTDQVPAQAQQPPERILALAPGELAVAIAVSPDGRRIAVARVPASPREPARIEIAAQGGGAPRSVWRGPGAALSAPSALHDPLLVWLDDAQIAFTLRDPASGGDAIYTLDADGPGEPRARGTGGAYGPGSAAAGTVMMLRTAEERAVQIGNAKAEELAPAVANVTASHVAGWTGDGGLVFLMGAPGRVVRAAPGRGAEPWPGTSDGVEIPDSVAGDSVIAHRIDAAAPPASRVVVERIDARGRHIELARLPADRAADVRVRCAGDRAPPCMLEEVTGSDVRWIQIDPAPPAPGERVLHSRGAGDHIERDAALSIDGKTLAIVEGTAEVVVVNLATGATRSYPVGGEAALESVAFAPGGDLWATALGFRGQRFGLMAFEHRARRDEYSLASRRGTSYKDALRWFWRPMVSPDGTRVAVMVRELHPQIVRVQGL